jgi:16S rRNA processing protein RimM
MNNKKEPIIIGHIGSTFGIHGWVKIFSYTDPRANILNYTPWQILVNGQWRIVKRLGEKIQGKIIIVHFENNETPEQSRLLNGLKIAINREQLPKLKKDEYYWTDLIGLTVINENNVILGVIENFIETGSNDVLIVKGEKKEHLIPYLRNSVVKEIDMEQKIVRVNWDPEY